MPNAVVITLDLSRFMIFVFLENLSLDISEFTETGLHHFGKIINMAHR